MIVTLAWMIEHPKGHSSECIAEKGEYERLKRSKIPDNYGLFCGFVQKIGQEVYHPDEYLQKRLKICEKKLQKKKCKHGTCNAAL